MQGVATGARAADSPTEPSTPQAQGTAAGSQDVVVTARRRQENLLSVPIAITAFHRRAPLTNFTGEANFRKFTPRASISIKPLAGQLVWFSYSRRFKGDGFDPRGSGASAPISNPAVGRTYRDIIITSPFGRSTSEIMRSAGRARYSTGG